jgi:PST family polysaccharide transporter
MPLTASLGLEAAVLNIDYIVVGRILGATAVGLYLLAFNVSTWIPNVVMGAVRWVAVSSFSKLSGDLVALREAVQRSIILIVILMLPASACLMVLATQLVTFLYGSRWTPGAAALQFLAVLSLTGLVTLLPNEVLSGIGRSPATLVITTGWAAALLPALVIGTRLDGIRGAAVAHALVSIGVAVPLAMFMLHRIGVPLQPIARSLARPLAAAVFAIALGFATIHLLPFSTFGQLVMGGTVIVASYVLTGFPIRELRRRLASGAVLTRFCGRSRSI